MRAMPLVLPSSSPLSASTAKRRSLLTLKDGGGVVVEARVDKAAKPSVAVFETAEGEYHLERADSNLLVLYGPGNAEVARKVKGAVELPGGESLPWKTSDFVISRYRLGEDMWVAKPRFPGPGRGFKAEVSIGFLAREDRGILAGLATVLTMSAIETKAAMDSIGNPG